MEKDKAKFPECGVVYDGDYYRQLPFLDYIRKESFEDWLKIHNIADAVIADPRNYGATGDGLTVSTEAVQAAADAAGRATGTAVLHISGGYYVTGSICIHSGTIVFIDADSAIVASKNPEKMNSKAFVCFENADNVVLTGGGKIICNGEYYVNLPLNRPRLTPLPYTKVPPVLFDKMGYPVDTIRYAYRSRIRYAGDPYQVPDEDDEASTERFRPAYSVLFTHCENVLIENIIIEDALSWTLVMDHCDHVTIRDTVINDNRHVANTDGIDIMNSSDVVIEHCFVSSADDGICIKSPRIRSGEGAEVERLRWEVSGQETEGKRTVGCHDIQVRDCTIVSVMNGIKIGTETYFDIEHVDIRNCRLMLPDIYPGMTTGIAIESCDGAHMRDVRVSGIDMDKVVCPLMILLNKRNKYGYQNDADKDERQNGGEISEVLIEDINAEDAELPSILTGFMYKASQDGVETQLCDCDVVEKRIKDITIKNFVVRYKDNKESICLQTQVAENVDDYPESNAFGDLPAYGIYIRHADHVSLDDIHITPRSMNTRPEIVREQVE